MKEWPEKASLKGDARGESLQSVMEGTMHVSVKKHVLARGNSSLGSLLQTPWHACVLIFEEQQRRL